MARKKMILKYIPHNKTRRDTLKKRSKSLIKKAREVAILCKAKACVIIYPEGESIPQVSSHDNEVAMLNRFMCMEDDDPFNKKMDQECFLKKRTGKLHKQLLKSERDSEENEIRLLLHKSMLVGNEGLSMEELTNVGCNVEIILTSIRDRMTKIRGQPPIYMPSQAQVQALAPNITGGMYTIGAPAMHQDQVSTPYVPSGIGAFGASVMHKAQKSIPYVTGGMDIIGVPALYQAQPPPEQNEEWLELMRSGGGDLDAPIFSGFNGGGTPSSIAGLYDNEMMHPFNQGAWFGSPWDRAGLGASSSAFPPL